MLQNEYLVNKNRRRYSRERAPRSLGENIQYYSIVSLVSMDCLDPESRHANNEQRIPDHAQYLPRKCNANMYMRSAETLLNTTQAGIYMNLRSNYFTDILISCKCAQHG